MLPQEQQEHHMLEHHMLPQEEHQMLPEAACDQLITHQDHRLALGEDSRGSAASSSAGGSSAANAAKGWCCKHQDKTQAKTHQDKTRNGASTPGYFWWVVLVCYIRAARGPCLLHACWSFVTCRVLLCPGLPPPSLVCLLHPCSSPLASCLSTAVVGRGLPCCHTAAAAMSRHSRHGTHCDRQQRCDTWQAAAICE